MNARIDNYLRMERMKIVTIDDHHDLLYRDIDGQVMIFAKLPFTPATRTERMHHAELLAASTLMLQALDRLLEHAQPDGWDHCTEEGIAWGEAFDAWLIAIGQEPRMNLIKDPIG